MEPVFNQLFLLGQILCITQDDKPVDSSMSNCPNTSVVLYVYKYDPDKKVYTVAGRLKMKLTHL